MSEPPPAKAPENPWLNIVFNIVLPTVILIQCSDEPCTITAKPWSLGPTWALIVGLSLPLAYGVYDYLKTRRINLFSILGIVAVLIKGGVALMKQDPALIIWTETIVPVVFGIVVLSTAWMKRPLIQRILLNPQVMDQPKIDAALAEQGNQGKVRPLMVRGSFLYAILMGISAVINYALAVYILRSEPGSSAFARELGRLTGLQFPVIGLPLMILSIGILIYLVKSLGKLTGLKFEEMLRAEHQPKSDSEPETDAAAKTD